MQFDFFKTRCSSFGVSGSNTDLAVLIPHAGLQAGADVGVPPHVHGLLLTPQELSIGVPPQFPLYQVKGEGHQLQTHTCTCLGMYVLAYTLCAKSRGKSINCIHTHTRTHTHVLDICLCTDLESGQRGRAANAHRYKQRESDTDIDTHAQTHISMCMYKDRQMQCAR